MDPTATFRRWQAAVADDQDPAAVDDACDAAVDLQGWLRAGGMEPSWSQAERIAFINAMVSIDPDANPLTGVRR